MPCCHQLVLISGFGMVFDWFNAKDVVIFAQEIATEMDGLLAQGARTGKPGKRDIKRFDVLVGRVQKFSKERPLNIYKKAKFLNTVKWQLKDAGHDNETIDELMKLLAAALSV